MMEIQIISPVYNESEAIESFLNELTQSLDSISDESVKFSIILVNDGSTDQTEQILTKYRSRYPIEIFCHSRNFGHQVAVWTGLANSNPNSYVVVLDSDLQDHPREISRMYSCFKDSVDVVLMQRKSRQDNLLKIGTARVYYTLIGKLSDGNTVKSVADFFGLSPRAKKALLLHGESVKYLRGLVQSLGFKTEILQYDRLSRIAGHTHYPFGKMIRLAVAGITGFSVKPLLLAAYLSLITSVVTVAIGLYALSAFLFDSFKQNTIEILHLLTLVIIGTNLGVFIIVMSLYVARISLEVKNRPISFLDKVIRNESWKDKND